jgi:hypothetical protein
VPNRWTRQLAGVEGDTKEKIYRLGIREEFISARDAISIHADLVAKFGIYSESMLG